MNIVRGLFCHLLLLKYMSSGGHEYGSSPIPGHYDPGMFKHVQTVDEFASVLDVPKKSIALIVPSGDKCKYDECPFDSIRGNYGYCPAHRQTWYPRENQRGADMHGPDFLRSVSGHLRVCECDDVVCKAVGYFPHQAAIYVHGKNGRGVQVALATPHLLLSDTKEKIKKGKKYHLFLYAWHFYPNH